MPIWVYTQIGNFLHESMTWKESIKGFQAYLMYERGLSAHSVGAYIRDVEKLAQYLELAEITKGPLAIEADDLRQMLIWMGDLGLEKTSRARILSGIRAFYKYLLVEDIMDENPAALIDMPKASRKIPDVLSVEEIREIFSVIDLSTDHGTRNRAMLEVLYACGLRVTELVTLQLSNFYPEIELIKVVGKNNKERLVPIGEDAVKHIGFYIDGVRRKQQNIHPEHADYMFLNRRGKKLTRVYVFLLIKELVEAVGIQKNVSPHTFRHSFATHLIDGGANLKAVQDMLGHESITTTEIYTHLDTSFLRDTILRYHPLNRSGKELEK